MSRRSRLFDPNIRLKDMSSLLKQVEEILGNNEGHWNASRVAILRSDIKYLISEIEHLNIRDYELNSKGVD